MTEQFAMGNAQFTIVPSAAFCHVERRAFRPAVETSRQGRNIHPHDSHGFTPIRPSGPLGFARGDSFRCHVERRAKPAVETSRRCGTFAITIHARNDSILNGGCFRKLDDQKGWYQTFEASGQNTLLLANYDDSHTVSNSNLRQVSLIRCMNYYLRDTIEKVVKVDISYSRIEKDLQAANYEADLYVCLNGQPRLFQCPFRRLVGSL